MSAGKPKRGRFARRGCGPEGTEAGRGHALGNNRVRARLGKGINTVRDLLAAGARLAHRRCACVRGWEKAQTGCATCSPQARDLPAAGVRELPGAAARLAHRRRSIKNYARRLSESLGQQKPGAGPHPETTACVRGWAKTTNTVRDVPGAAAQVREKERKG